VRQQLGDETIGLSDVAMKAPTPVSASHRTFTMMIDFIAPPLSIRRQFLQLIQLVWSLGWREGVGVALERINEAIVCYRRTGSLIIPAPPPPPVYTYAEWIADHEPAPETLAAQRVAARQFAYQPLITLIMPVYNPPLEVFDLAVRSVQQQTYPHWQLCLANGGDDPAIRTYIDRLAAQESRVRAVHLAQNLGISGNSNAALKLAAGEFVSFFDHDDKLAPTLLFAVAAELNRDPAIDIIYFDEDKISADDRERSEPWLKPAWSPDMMLSVNLVGHGLFRRSLVEEGGGFDPATDGAQDWDLALRCSLRAGKIVHIPQILYHWRKIPGSAAVDAQAKPYAFAAQARALQKHLAALGADGFTVKLTSAGARVDFPARDAKISIIIPTKDQFHFIQRCVSSLLHKTHYPNLEIIVIDTGSTEQAVLAYYEELAHEPRVHLVHYQDDFNYSRANNVGVQHASGDVFLFLNNDTEAIEPDWLETMAGWALRKDIGVVGAKLLYDDGSIQHGGVVVGLEGVASHIFGGMREGQFGVFGSTEWVRNYMAVTGACLMLRREVFERIGAFDEEYRLTFSDVELCLRALASGYRNVWLPFVRMLHHEGGTRGYYMPNDDIVRVNQQMWQLVLAGDPYFHPALSAVQRQPTLASPVTKTRFQVFYELLDYVELLPAPPHSAESHQGALPDQANHSVATPIDAATVTAVMQQIQARAASSSRVTYKLVDRNTPAIHMEIL